MFIQHAKLFYIFLLIHRLSQTPLIQPAPAVLLNSRYRIGRRRKVQLLNSDDTAINCILQKHLQISGNVLIISKAKTKWRLRVFIYLVQQSINKDKFVIKMKQNLVER